MTQAPAFYLGAARPLDGKGANAAFHLPPHHLATHGVVLGMTGSGKTGLITVLVEEALRTGVPVLMIDVKVRPHVDHQRLHTPTCPFLQ